MSSLICANMEQIFSVQPDVFIRNDPYLNSPVICEVFPKINLHLWKTDTPALQVPEAILIQTLEKGTEGLALRRKEEYKLWENSELTLHSNNNNTNLCAAAYSTDMSHM